MTLSNLERRDKRVIFFRPISLITLVPFNIEYKFGRITGVGRVYF